MEEEKEEQIASIAALLEMALFWSPEFEDGEDDEKLMIWISEYLYDHGIRFDRSKWRD